MQTLEPISVADLKGLAELREHMIDIARLYIKKREYLATRWMNGAGLEAGITQRKLVDLVLTE